MKLEKISHCNLCNTPGVCQPLSNGFELKHDMLSGDECVKIKSTRVSSNLNLDNAPLLTYGSLLRLCKSKAKHAHSIYITSTCIHLDQWKSFILCRTFYVEQTLFNGQELNQCLVYPNRAHKNQQNAVLESRNLAQSGMTESRNFSRLETEIQFLVSCSLLWSLVSL